ncbi:4Fe-4S dicluster domain-containing protein [Flavobacteriaceae bacterium Ap0902]|nr:4Fe-4S dicluster domain-containing protein [Flavobacteriaceae bacterium Ap0902]
MDSLSYLSQMFFLIALVCGIGFFIFNVRKVFRNINLGRPTNRTDNPNERWTLMTKVALGQSKMVVRPVAGILHILVYAGFIIINLEVLEIIIDGLFGTHRVFSFLGPVYDALIGSFEVLALLVIVAVIIFWIRRNIQKIPRFWKREMKGWPKDDANYILYIECVLMLAFLSMNAADYYAHANAGEDLAGSFPISKNLFFFFNSFGTETLHIIERVMWWFHILGILFFLNYLYYSKHFHILSAFPNVWFSKLEPKGQLNNLESVKNEVKLMMDPNADPFAAPSGDTTAVPETFGAKDVFDLTKVQLLNAYSCTECGRCTSECPANITGKKLSPRKIMMDTRDRLEDVGKNIDKNDGKFVDDGKKLIGDYIQPEEIWACTSCNACTQACPINIDPLSIIIDIRRYLVMEESAAPMELNLMMQNVENNGAPWQFNIADRLNWAESN